MIDAYFPVAKHKDTPIAGIGAPGKDGFSPAVSISSITGGHRVTITGKSGEHSFDVLDGVCYDYILVKIAGFLLILLSILHFSM